MEFDQIVLDEKPLKELCDQCAEPNPDDPPPGVPSVKSPSSEVPQIAGRSGFDVPQEVPAEPDVIDAGSGLAAPVLGAVGGRQVLPFPVVVAPPANVVPRVVVAPARRGEPPPVVVVPPVNVVPPIVGAPPARPAEAPPARPPGAAPREQVPLGTGASAGGPAGASGSYRAGYNQYLRTAEVSRVAVIAVPGLAGILLLTAGGGFIGYRQAKAGQVVRAEGIGRFLQ